MDKIRRRLTELCKSVQQITEDLKENHELNIHFIAVKH